MAPLQLTRADVLGSRVRAHQLDRTSGTLAGRTVRDARGAEGRDAVWNHPDLVPTSADLDDPLGFARVGSETEQSGDEDFDAALAELLDEADHPEQGPGDQAPEAQDPDGQDPGADGEPGPGTSR